MQVLSCSMDVYWFCYSSHTGMSPVKTVNDTVMINVFSPEATERAMRIYTKLFLDLG